MSDYVIGDIHGCFATFSALLDEIRFQQESDHLWFVGDLVNKGPDSISMLRWIYHHRYCAQMVLGNHDLHLLRVYFGLREPKGGDRFGEVLAAGDAPKLIRWLLRRPLILEVGTALIVHAGILPAWQLDRTVTFAWNARRRLEQKPRKTLSPSNGWAAFDWNQPDPAGALRVFTAVRCCSDAATPDFEYTGPPEQAPESLKPWYSFPAIQESGRIFFFGHWARLGLHITSHAVCLDSGCAYGGPLSAWRLDDQRLFQVPNQGEGASPEDRLGI